MNRFITTLVQLAMLGTVIVLARMMLPMLKEDWQEIKNDLRR